LALKKALSLRALNRRRGKSGESCGNRLRIEEDTTIAGKESKFNPVNWFEIPVNDLQRAIAFYEKSLQVKLSREEMGPMKMAMFPSDMEGLGAAGSLVKADGYGPCAGGTLVYFRVKDIEATLKRIVEKGGKILMPKTAIGKYGFIAQFEDTEGNREALHSMN
jgi:hypothetical protein